MSITDYADLDLPAPGENTDGLISVPTNVEIQERVVSVRRNMGDLPDLPAKMNTIGVVLSYELFGFSERDTATVTGLTDEQVGRIRMLDAYDTMRKNVIDAVIERDTDDVRDLFGQQSRFAANRVFDHMSSPDPAISLVASRDVLDRGGFGAKQITEHRHTLEGGLTIEYVTRNNSEDVPIIDMKDITDG